MSEALAKIEIEKSPFRMLAILAGGLSLTILSFAIALGYVGDFRSDDFVIFIAWFGAVFFTACFCVGLWQLLSIKGPVIILDQNGFSDKRVAPKAIAWSDVEALGEYEISGQKFVIVKVADEALEKLPLTRTAKISLAGNLRMGIDGLAITALGTKLRHAALVDHFANYLQAYHGQTRQNV